MGNLLPLSATLCALSPEEFSLTLPEISFGPNPKLIGAPYESYALNPRCVSQAWSSLTTRPVQVVVRILTTPCSKITVGLSVKFPEYS